MLKRAKAIAIAMKPTHKAEEVEGKGVATGAHQSPGRAWARRGRLCEMGADLAEQKARYDRDRLTPGASAQQHEDSDQHKDRKYHRSDLRGWLGHIGEGAPASESEQPEGMAVYTQLAITENERRKGANHQHTDSKYEKPQANAARGNRS